MVYTTRRKASRRRKSGARSSSLLRNPKRRRKAKRRNAWYNDAKGHKKAAKLGWSRKKKKRSPVARKKRKNPFRKTYRRSMTRRRNPVYRRRSRKSSYRRNPISGIRKAFSKAWLMQSLEIALGMGLGMFGMPVIYAIVPEGMKKHRNWFGLFHVAIGSVLFTMAKGRRVKTIGGIVAGTGIYDLIAANTQDFLGLPMLPSINSAVSNMIPGSSSNPALPNEAANGLGLSYYGTNDAVSADYQRVGTDFESSSSLTVGLGDDDNPFCNY